MSETTERCLRTCESLIELMEEEIGEIGYCISGDIQDGYVDIIKEEKKKLDEIRRNCYFYNNNL